MFRIMRKTVGINLVAALAALAGVGAMTPGAAEAAQLLMFHDTDCGACQDFWRHTEPMYNRSDLARDLPLVVLDLDDPSVARKLRRAERSGRIDPVWHTPTFVLWDNGEEVARFSAERSGKGFLRTVARLARRHGLVDTWRPDPDLTNRQSIDYKHPIDRDRYRNTPHAPGRPIKVRW